MDIFRVSDHISRETKRLSRKKSNLKIAIEEMKMTYKDTGYIDATKTVHKTFRQLKLSMIEEQQKELCRLRKVYRLKEKLEDERHKIGIEEIRPRTTRIARIFNIEEGYQWGGEDEMAKNHIEAHQDELELLNREVQPFMDRSKEIDRELQALEKELELKWH